MNATNRIAARRMSAQVAADIVTADALAEVPEFLPALERVIDHIMTETDGADHVLMIRLGAFHILQDKLARVLES